MTACKVGPTYVRPDVALAPTWSETDPRLGTDGAIDIAWWKTLGDPTLDHLIEIAFQQNLSLQTAGLRILEARAQLGIATAGSIFLVVQTVLKVLFAGSHLLWFAGVILYLFFATALGMFLGTVSRSMAQFALLIILVVVVLQLLSGGSTPVESQPRWLQSMTYFLPTRHFVSFSQVIIYRGGGFDAVWKNFALVAGVGLAFFIYSVSLFRKSISVSK